MNKATQQVSNTCLELFDTVPVLNPIIGSNVQEVFPSTSLDESSLEFEYETDRNIFLDLRDTNLLLKVRMPESAITIKKETDGEEVLDVYPVNNFMHSLFSNCEVYLNNQQVYNSNGLYPHKAFISNEFSSTHVENLGMLQCHGFEFEAKPGDTTSAAFTKRQAALKTGSWTLYGKLSIDAFTCEKLLLPKTRVRIKLIRSRPNFHLICDKAVPSGAIKISHASLFTRRVSVQEDYLRVLENQLTRQPARYHFNELDARQFIVSDGQNQFIQENVFNNAPIRRLVVAMNTNSAFTGSFAENPFHYQKFGLREIRVIRGNQPIVYMSTVENAQAYVTTMKAMKFNDETPGLPLVHFNEHFILVFDLTSLQDAGDQIFYPEIIGGSLRLEMYFENALEKPIEIMVLGERLSTIYIDRAGSVVKNA